MGIFNKKDTLTKSISFMALMAAINVVLSLATAFVPFLSVFLVIFLPLTSALVEAACKDKYFPIYALGTVGLSVAVTFWNFDFTIFYVVPSIITGYLFGLFSKKEMHPMWSILVATIAQTAITFAFVPLIKLLTGRNLIDDIIIIFNLGGFSSFKNYILLVFFVFSLFQIILSYIAVISELKKFGFSEAKNVDFGLPIEPLIFASIGVSVVTYFFIKSISFLMIFLTFYFTFFAILKTIKEKRFGKLIFYGVFIFLNIFIFAILNPLMTTGQILLIEFSPLFIGIISLLNIN